MQTVHKLYTGKPNVRRRLNFVSLRAHALAQVIGLEMPRTTLPDELVQQVKRLAHELTRGYYARKRDELLRRAVVAYGAGEDVYGLLREESRQALMADVRSTRAPAHTQDKVRGSVLHGTLGRRVMPSEPSEPVAR